MEIRLQSVRYHYYGDRTSKDVLQDLSFVLKPGECVALLGPSGSGKSTLAQILNGLLRPVQGNIFTNGIEWTYKPEELKRLRKHVGLVFQFPEAQIFEPTVYEEVAFAAKQDCKLSDRLPERVRGALTDVGLDPDRFEGRNPFRLSGGEARLVTIASLLVVDPDWLILDEPTLGLDDFHIQKIVALLHRRKERKRGTLLITHDLDLAAEVCPRTLILVGGVLKYDGPTFALIRDHDLSGEFSLDDTDLLRLWKKLRMHFEEVDAVPPASLTDWIRHADSDKRRRIVQLLEEEFIHWNASNCIPEKDRY